MAVELGVVSSEARDTMRCGSQPCVYANRTGDSLLSDYDRAPTECRSCWADNLMCGRFTLRQRLNLRLQELGAELQSEFDYPPDTIFVQ